MYIYKRGKYYNYDFMLNGRRFRGPTKAKNKVLAQNIAEKIRDKLISRKYNIIIEEKSFYSLCEEYINFVKTYKKSFGRDIYSINHFKEFFEDCLLIDIDSKLIEEYMKIRIYANIKPRTINRELTTLRHMLNKAIDWEYISSNPFRKIKFHKNKKVKFKLVGFEKLKLLINYLEDPVKSMVIIALNTGMRKGEIFNLQWNDIDFSNKTIKLSDTKSNDEEIIIMNREVLNVLINLRLQYKNSDYVFGKKYSDIRSSFNNACKKAEINMTFHDLRHNFISYLIKKKVHPKIIQELARHKDIKTTMQIYSHVSDQDRKDAISKLSFCGIKCGNIVSLNSQNK